MSNKNSGNHSKGSDKKHLKSFICHRRPDRTFKINDHYFPVCSRCTGIYIGAIAYFVLSYLFEVDYSAFTLLTAILMLLPAFSDALTQYYGIRESNNTIRFITGLTAGIGVIILIKSLKYVLIGLM
jgi:uncharacterized membrane protein